jgi:hypothetical protein
LLGVAPPGSTDFPGGEPATFQWSGSVTHQGNIRCRPGPASGTQEVVATTAGVVNNYSEWAVTTTVLRFAFDASTPIVTVAPSPIAEVTPPPAAVPMAEAFTVVSSTHSRVAATDPAAQDLMAGSDICGAPVGPG